MRILVVGGGAREHTLCWSLSTDPSIEALYCAPGNAGTAAVATNVSLATSDTDGIVSFAGRERIDLTVIGPEAPLVAGLADALAARGLAVFGPNRAGARIEGSKAWAKDLCERYGIPAARSAAFTEAAPGLEYLDSLKPPYVVKADGLAAGKGVTVTEDLAAAADAVADCLVRSVFGEAGSTVVIEEYLEGPEVSALALTDGRTVLPLALAQDFKRAGDGDVGPNTGGMGAYSPLPFVEEDTARHIAWDILTAAVRAMEAEGVRYAGCLYAGLVLTADGPKVLEFNCRFGDPETQVVLPRLASGLAPLLQACAEGSLDRQEATWKDEACVGVVLASGGYPGDHITGLPIEGIATAASVAGVELFHAGTASGPDGRLLTAGGRVLTVSALGEDLAEARARAYEACGLISFEGMMFRHDIALRTAERLVLNTRH